MFLSFFGLREQPFGVTPNTRYIYTSSTYREAFASVTLSIEENLGFSALIGDPGMGKTTLLFSLMGKYAKEAYTAFILHTDLNARELLRQVMNDLGIPWRGADKIGEYDQFHEFVSAAGREGKRVMIIIDEAQNLSDAALESLRQLSNFETPETKLVHITLAGQMGLGMRLQSPRQAQLLQRIPIISQLYALDKDETVEYIGHRLRIAGYFGPLPFTEEALNTVVAQSGGIPRNINAICFNALSLACALRQKTVDAAVMAEVSADRNLLFRIPGGSGQRQARAQDRSQPLGAVATLPVSRTASGAAAAAPAMAPTAEAQPEQIESGANRVANWTGAGTRRFTATTAPARTNYPTPLWVAEDFTGTANEAGKAHGAVKTIVNVAEPATAPSPARSSGATAEQECGERDPFAPPPRPRLQRLALPVPIAPAEGLAKTKRPAAESTTKASDETHVAPAPDLNIAKQTDSDVDEETNEERNLKVSLRRRKFVRGGSIDITQMLELALLIPMILWIIAFLLALYGERMS